MQLKFVKNHKSITKYNTIDLPDLTIVTGNNGSGKSHLLESLKNGSSQIDSIQNSEIVLFDYKTFFLENEQTFNNQQLNQEKQNAWNRFSQTSNPNVKASLTNFKNQLGEDNYQKILQIGKGKSFFSIRKRDFKEDLELYNKYIEYKNRFYSFLKHKNLVNSAETKGLKSLALRLDRTLDELDEDDFFDYYTPVVLKNDFLPSQIGKMFLDYWYKYQMFEYKWIKKEKTYDEERFQANFEKKHGPKPWKLIEQILESFDSFQYTVNNPEGIIIEPFRTKTFSLTLRHKTKGISIPFDNLSSGEKILFSLVLSIYKSVGDKLFPSALLLDEIDASEMVLKNRTQKLSKFVYHEKGQIKESYLYEV